MNKPCSLLGVLAVAVLASAGLASSKRSFDAELSGKHLKPAVETKATGAAEFRLSEDGKTLTYRLTVKDIANVTGAHVHKGKKGEDGPPVAGLFGGPKKEGPFSGVLAEGTISEKDLMGDLKGRPLEELVKLLRSEDAYVNVHTDAHPAGEIRGEID